jgi:hypothetical protein
MTDCTKDYPKHDVLGIHKLLGTEEQTLTAVRKGIFH